MKRLFYLLLFPLITSAIFAFKSGESPELQGAENLIETKSIKPDATVAADGSAEFKSVQAAIDAAPSNRKNFYYIYIKKGVYKEVITIPQDKPYIYLIGEDSSRTLLTYDNYAKKLDATGKEYGTSGSASFFVLGSFFVAEKITFSNTAGINAGQALAININSELSAFKNCRFLGHQDTWFAGNGTRQYLKHCFIQGSVDFIFGGSSAFFEKCELQSTRAGYITAASTPDAQQYGYVFDQCKLTAVPTVKEQSVYLGRPWRPSAHVVYLNCDMGKHIKKEGWHNWGNQSNERTAFYGEYQSRGAGYQVDKRVPWSRQLTTDEVEKYSLTQVIGSWSPFIKGKVQL